MGIGWSVCSTPTPHMALVILIKVPWDQTNQEHILTLELVDADGRPVMMDVDEQGNPTGLRIDIGFEVGRPPGVLPGSPIDLAQSINVDAGMPLAPDQNYEWRLEIDGAAVTARSFRVSSTPPPA